MNEATALTTQKVATVSVIGASGTEVLTGDSILTMAGLNEISLLGISYDVWFSFVLFFSMLLIVGQKLYTFYVKVINPLLLMARKESKKEGK